MTFESIIMISAIIAAVTAILAAAVATFRLFRKFDDLIGTDRTGRTLSERLERVEHQLWENGGTSLADRVNNIEMHVLKVSTEIEIIKDITLGLRSASVSSDTKPQVKTRRKAS